MRSTRSLCDHGAGSGALVSPGRGEGADGLVVAGETVDTGLDENKAAKKFVSSQTIDRHDLV